MKKKQTPPEISLILPVYNEEDNIKLQYQAIVKAMSPLGISHEIIFVDDGSTDGTTGILRGIALEDKKVKLVFFRRNFGQTAAMGAGIDYAAGGIIIFMDSDLQNDPDDIPLLLSKMKEGYDVVSGWRKKRQDKMITRKIPSWIANRIIAKVTGVSLHDLGCSLKAYKSEVIKKVNLYGEMHRFIPVHASWVGARIAEIPVNHYPRKYGTSKYGIKRTFKVLLDLVTVKFMGSYSTKPIYLFGGTGLLMLVGASVSLGFVIGMKVINRTNMTGNPLLYLSILFTILSVLFIQMGILAELLIRIYHETKENRPYHVRELINIDETKK